MKSCNILIAGVGGQGSLLASKLLGRLFLSRGYDVKVNEVHGMSQRGGSVITTVRAGKRVDSPLVAEGECDLLLALERLEALRWVSCLAPEGKLVASLQRIPPMPVITGAADYPEQRPPGLWVDALALAERAGSPQCANVALLGAASRFLEFEPEEWARAIAECVPAKAVEMNIRAFELGRAEGREREGNLHKPL
ncbi:MAG: indolepyruvate oxidoreductase subunit beta [Oscillospiraceae bacterium]|nr:indolepyruvate oxidoreductase subunit beta [Oscillospiraceae bacterium]